MASYSKLRSEFSISFAAIVGIFCIHVLLFACQIPEQSSDFFFCLGYTGQVWKDNLMVGIMSGIKCIIIIIMNCN